MPAEVFHQEYEFLKPGELLTFEEITRIAEIFARGGVVKVKLTGGEPLLRPWLPELVRALSSINDIADLALITNGAHLAHMAGPLRDAGLKRLTVSLDSLDEITFARMNGRAHRLAPVLKGIEAAMAAGFQGIKLNTVVIRGMNDHEVIGMVRHFRGTGHVVRFIEFMDVGNRNGWRRELVVPTSEILQAIRAEFPLEPVQPVSPGEVASRYRFTDGQGEIGFISSVSQPFCSECTRMRMSADGKLYTCLFAGSGFDLRGPLRRGADDEEILSLIAGLWKKREDRYSEMRAERAGGNPRKVEMYHIGG
jgi:cyclic pyranopterin phosphate synthase